LKVFITGGAGFIGRNLSQFLLKKNHHVTIFDDLSNSSLEKISELVKNGAQFVRGDITNMSELDSIKNHDFVIHLAAKINVQESIKDPDSTMKVNVDGTINLLKSCANYGIKNLIVASTAAVYDDLSNNEEILDEKSKTNPISPYGKSKLLMEEKVEEFSNSIDINCIILRCFNIFGIGQSDEYAGVISKFIQNIRNNESLTIFGDGMQTRDFISINDVVIAIHEAISKIHGKRGQHYNIATGKSIPIKELAKLMIKLSHKDLEIVFTHPKKGDLKFSKASISSAKKELDFIPKSDFKNEIKKMLDDLSFT